MVIACEPPEARQGDGLCGWEGVYRGHYPALVHQACRRGCDSHEAEDVVQELFLRLFQLDRLSALVALPGDRQRSYLLKALGWRVAHLFRRKAALRRGGGVVVESLQVWAEQGRDIADPQAWVGLAERRWAAEVLERALQRFGETATAAEQASVERSVLGEAVWEQGEKMSGRERVALHRSRLRLRQCVAVEAGLGVDVEGARRVLFSAVGTGN